MPPSKSLVEAMRALGLEPVKKMPTLFFGQVKSLCDGDDIVCLLTVVQSKKHPDHYYSSINLNNKAFTGTGYGRMDEIKNDLHVLLVMYEVEQLRRMT